MTDPFILFNIFKNSNLFCCFYSQECLFNVYNIKYAPENKIEIPIVVIDKSSINLANLSKIYQENCQSHLITCLCGANNVVSICNIFLAPNYLVFCLDFLDYNTIGILNTYTT